MSLNSTSTSRVSITTKSILQCEQINEIMSIPARMTVALLFTAFIVGIPLNLVVIVKMHQLKLYRRHSYAFYVYCLSVADILLILNEFSTLFLNFQWAVALKLSDSAIDTVSQWGILICNVMPIMKYYFWYVTSWLEIAMGIERLVSVKFPLQVAFWFTVRQAYLITFLIILTGVAPAVPACIRAISRVNSYSPSTPLWQDTVRCGYSTDNFEYFFQATITAETFCSIAPCAFLAVVSVLLVLAVRDALSNPLAGRKHLSRATATICFMCVAFCVLSMSYTVNRVIFSYYVNNVQSFGASIVPASCLNTFLQFMVFAGEGVRTMSPLTNAGLYIARSGHFRRHDKNKTVLSERNYMEN